MASESFADTPVSIAELRSAADDDCNKWTPRDLLVNLLRRIDRGEIDPKILTIVYEIRHEERGSLCVSRHAGGRLYERVGLLSAAIQDLLSASFDA
jgi:hypothetical protein